MILQTLVRGQRGRALPIVALVVGAVVLLAAWAVGGSNPALAVCSSAPNIPKVVTDKADYSPADIVHIDGCGFDKYVGQNVLLSITRPNLSVDSATLVIDSSGDLTYDYKLSALRANSP